MLIAVVIDESRLILSYPPTAQMEQSWACIDEQSRKAVTTR